MGFSLTRHAHAHSHMHTNDNHKRLTSYCPSVLVHTEARVLLKKRRAQWARAASKQEHLLKMATAMLQLILQHSSSGVLLIQNKMFLLGVFLCFFRERKTLSCGSAVPAGAPHLTALWSQSSWWMSWLCMYCCCLMGYWCMEALGCEVVQQGGGMLLLVSLRQSLSRSSTALSGSSSVHRKSDDGTEWYHQNRGGGDQKINLWSIYHPIVPTYVRLHQTPQRSMHFTESNSTRLTLENSDLSRERSSERTHGERNIFYGCLRPLRGTKQYIHVDLLQATRRNALKKLTLLISPQTPITCKEIKAKRTNQVRAAN